MFTFNKSKGSDNSHSVKEYEEDLEKIIKYMDLLSKKVDLNVKEKVAPNLIKYNNKKLEDSWNNLLSNLFKFNNNSVTEMNDALNMTLSSNNTQNMLESVDFQNEQLEEMSLNGKEIEASIENVAVSIQNISKFSNEVDEKSIKSSEEMSQTVNFIKQSFDEIQELNKEMEFFKNKTLEINTVIDIVKSIADETNLLSLNATIEAARAGEAGKGFSVVAYQIRKLSDNTKQSVNSIQSIVNTLQNDINGYVQKINDTSDKLKNGCEQMEDAVNNVNNISESIQEISDHISEISATVEQQTVNTENFLQGINTLNSKSNNIKEFCNSSNKELFTIGRVVDKVRGRIARFSSMMDYINILSTYITDHNVFVWRIYNMLLGNEQIQVEKMNNPNTCKMGVWCNSEANENIINNKSFMELKQYHEELHKIAEKVINEYYSGNFEKAKALYNGLEPNRQGIEKCLKELCEFTEREHIKM